MQMIMIKTKVAFLNGPLLSPPTKKFKNIPKALIGWKKAGPLKKPHFF